MAMSVALVQHLGAVAIAGGFSTRSTLEAHIAETGQRAQDSFPGWPGHFRAGSAISLITAQLERVLFLLNSNEIHATNNWTK